MVFILVFEFMIELIILEVFDVFLNYVLVKDGKVEKICFDLNVVFDVFFGIS